MLTPAIAAAETLTRARAGAATPLLSISDLAVSFSGPGATRVRAVEGVGLSVFPGQTLAIVGESGSGKSVTALSVLRLLPSESASIEQGQIVYSDEDVKLDLLNLSPRAMRRVRGGRIAMIFQEPMSSLNPVFTVGEQIMEGVRLHQGASSRAAHGLAERALRDVGMADPSGAMAAFPHQFSGGMRQRAMIAMALACKPRLLLADEPTTALDVTVQAQVLSLLRDIQRRTGMGVMLITHSLGVVSENADVVCVMLAGRIVEYASVHELLERPLHPYTRGLIASAPSLRERRDRLLTVADVVGDGRGFEIPIAAQGDDRLRAWWPGLPSVNAAPRTPGVDDTLMLEVAPDHWVRVFTSERIAGQKHRPPRLDIRREEAPGE